MSSKLYKKVERCYNAGEVIFQQGAATDGIYSVKLGWVSVYKTKPTPNGPVDIEIVRLGPGSMFGEMGMLDQTVRDASVKAVDYVECIVITKEMFENQMTALPPWVVNFIKILISRLRITNEKLLSTLQTLEAHGLAPTDAKEAAAHAAAVPTTDPSAAVHPAPPAPAAAGAPGSPGAAGGPPNPAAAPKPAAPGATAPGTAPRPPQPAPSAPAAPTTAGVHAAKTIPPQQPPAKH